MWLDTKQNGSQWPRATINSTGHENISISGVLYRYQWHTLLYVKFKF